MAEHGDAKLTDLLVTLPASALGQRPRPLPSGLWAAAAVSLSGLQKQDIGFREQASA
jgi:hypothetical protein